jgi:uncharacterized OsmC-like protein
MEIKYLGGVECIANIKGNEMKLVSGKIAKENEISPIDLFLAGVGGCTIINAGRELEKNGIKADLRCEVSAIKEDNLIKKVIVKIFVKVDAEDKEKIKELIINGADKCIISKSIGFVEKEVII